MLKVNRPIPADRIKLLVFDLDGTLVDSRVDLTNSVNAMLAHHNCPQLPSDVIAGFIGDGAPMLIRRALGNPDDEQWEESSEWRGPCRPEAFDAQAASKEMQKGLPDWRNERGSD